MKRYIVRGSGAWLRLSVRVMIQLLHDDEIEYFSLYFKS